MIQKLKERILNPFKRNKIIDTLLVKDKMDIYQENLVSQYQVSSECLIVEYHVSLSFKIDNNREKLIEYLSRNISSNDILLHGEVIPVKVILFQYHENSIYRISQKTYHTVGISKYSKQNLKREIGRLRVSSGKYLIKLEVDDKIKELIDTDIYIEIQKREDN
jgi:hypothetical protein